MHLFTPTRLGALALPHRIVMAPMTRLRTAEGLVPSEHVATYYGQRASAALIVSESLVVAPHGEGFGPLPGLYTDAQREGWRAVAAAVHASGGRISAQLATIGRARTAAEVTTTLEPAHLTTSEMSALVDQFGAAAKLARDAGFDAIEIHSGNGFLLDQFLREGSNRRGDRYGGSLDNRIRLLLEIREAATASWPLDRIGVRVSPSAPAAGLADPSSTATFTAVLRALEGLAYVHATRATAADRARGPVSDVPLDAIRESFEGPLVLNGDFTLAEAEAVVANGMADAISFARLFISNPDLPARARRGSPLAALDPETLYSGGSRGYIDYPIMP